MTDLDAAWDILRRAVASEGEAYAYLSRAQAAALLGEIGRLRDKRARTVRRLRDLRSERRALSDMLDCEIAECRALRAGRDRVARSRDEWIALHDQQTRLSRRWEALAWSMMVLAAAALAVIVNLTGGRGA